MAAAAMGDLPVYQHRYFKLPPVTNHPSFRASELDRVLTCHGSITLVPLVAPRDGDEGYEGAFIHWAIADRLVRLHGAIPPEGGLPPPEVPAGYKLPAFSVWMIDWGVRHVLETIPSHWAIFVELAMEHEFARWRNTGHADIVGINPEGTEAIGIDWKTGRDPVDPADNNEQVGSYIVLLKSEWPSLRKVTFQIAQPRADEDAGFERVSTVCVEDGTLELLPPTLDARVCAAMDNAMEVNSGRKQCRWCPVRVQCPALEADKEFMRLTLTPQAVAAIKKQPDDAKLGDWVITMRTLKVVTEDAENLLHARLDSTECIQAGCGTTITRKIQKGSWSVPNPQTFFTALRDLFPQDAQIAEVMKPSMTRIKDQLADTMNIPKTGKAAVTAESVFQAKLAPLAEQGERKLLQFSQ